MYLVTRWKCPKKISTFFMPFFSHLTNPITWLMIGRQNFFSSSFRTWKGKRDWISVGKMTSQRLWHWTWPKCLWTLWGLFVTNMYCVGNIPQQPSKVAFVLLSFFFLKPPSNAIFFPKSYETTESETVKKKLYRLQVQQGKRVAIKSEITNQQRQL